MAKGSSIRMTLHDPLQTLSPQLTSHFIFRKAFYARPLKLPDGTLNLMEWEVGVPGKAGVWFTICIFSFRRV